jgi:Uncharacterized conserved protein
MEVKKVVEIVASAGEILLSNGAEAYRVEETVTRICKSYGFDGECISTSTGIFISVSAPDEEVVTSIKRIKQRRVDLYKVDLINSFSRNLSNNLLSYEEAKKVLKEIDNVPNYTLKVRLMAACMTSLIYTLFFNGTVIDALIAALITFGIFMMLEKISQVGSFQFLEYYLSGFIIGAASFAAQSLLPGINEDKIIIGAIINLLPGVALTNGIKDAIYGDFVSGSAKLGEAILILVAMGVGIGTALSLCMKWM